MKKHLFRTSLLGFAAATLCLSACMRGGPSTSPPVHLVQDMDFQQKIRAQSKVDFAGWSDHRGMRRPVSNAFGKTIVVARDSLPNEKLAHTDSNNAFVKKNPLALTSEVMERGRNRFDIYCAVCHGYTGQGGNDPKQGHGLVGRRWPAVIPNFHFVEGKDNRVPLLSDGEFFDTITNGKNTMPAYGARISVEDRWAIVHYVRALQALSK